MSILLSVKDLGKHIGSQTLFENLSFGVFANERLGIIGPNGTGKSTLLKILSGALEPDDGSVVASKNTRQIYVAQSESVNEQSSIWDVLHDQVKSFESDEVARDVLVSHAISQVNFAKPDEVKSIKWQTLSGGWRKRLLVSAALIQNPDLILLDEPTNHLDFEGIAWLEESLQRYSGALVLVSHDRQFLANVTNQTMELSPRYPDGFLKLDGAYPKFLELREQWISEQERRQDALANVVRRESEWLRRQPKARSTKAKGRVDEALAMQDELREMKQRARAERRSQFAFDSDERQTKVLLKAHKIGKAYNDVDVIKGLSLVLSPNKIIGLVGNNGSGKSTLIKMLASELAPDSGSVKLGHEVVVFHFDQNRELLDPTETLQQALAPSGGDSVVFRDKPVHIITWAKRFLFKPEQLGSPVSSLSGGEKARVMIARLMLKRADVLLLDEPTNDLDIPSLELLEESLLDFPGAVLLITHDRYLMDRVADQVLALDGYGEWGLYADLNQWAQKKRELEKQRQKYQKKENAAPEPANNKPKTSKKLSYKDQYALEHIEEWILEAEEEAKKLDESIKGCSGPELASERFTELCEELAKKQQKIEQLYAQWDELEAKKTDLSL